MINSLESGGSERTASRLLPGLSKEFTVYLVLFRDAVFYDIPKSVKVLPLSKTRNAVLFILLSPLSFIKLIFLIRKYKPHKIVSFLEIANFVNILLNRSATISFRTSLHFFETGIIKKAHRILINLLYPRAQKIIVNSSENALDLSERLHIPRKKITTVPNPINLSAIERCSQEKVNMSEFPQNKKIFVTIGRFDVQKNIHTLIETFSFCPPKNSILLIIGDGPQKEIFSKMIQQHQLQDTVFLLGKKKNVFPYLVRADYFIFSSKVEGFPNVLIEAMACNLPIITSDFKTGAREIINPTLPYNKTLSYPHYGPNGVLLGIENFTKDFEKINLASLTQKRIGIGNFEENAVVEKWCKILHL